MKAHRSGWWAFVVQRKGVALAPLYAVQITMPSNLSHTDQNFGVYSPHCAPLVGPARETPEDYGARARSPAVQYRAIGTPAHAAFLPLFSAGPEVGNCEILRLAVGEWENLSWIL